jgi:hypothetical protein
LAWAKASAPQGSQSTCGEARRLGRLISETHAPVAVQCASSSEPKQEWPISHVVAGSWKLAGLCACWSKYGLCSLMRLLVNFGSSLPAVAPITRRSRVRGLVCEAVECLAAGLVVELQSGLEIFCMKCCISVIARAQRVRSKEQSAPCCRAALFQSASPGHSYALPKWTNIAKTRSSV